MGEYSYTNQVTGKLSPQGTLTYYCKAFFEERVMHHAAKP